MTFNVADNEVSMRDLGTVALTLATLIWIWYHFLSSPNLNFLPRAGKAPGWFGFRLAAVKRDFLTNGAQILHAGYRKHKNGMFLVQTLNVERVVLSPKYIEEINKTVPEESLDMVEGLRERLMSSQTNLDTVFRSPLHIDVCKSQLTQNLHSLISPLDDETRHSLSLLLPSQVELPAYDTIVKIITANASRMFGGTHVSRNQEWLATAAAYSMDVVRVAMQLRMYPAFLRPLVYPWLELSKTLDAHMRTTRRCFGKTFEQKLMTGQPTDSQETSVDMIQWLSESASGADRNPDILAQNMLFMALASVHTSAATTIHALFDLCAAPEYAQPIRDEVKEAVQQHGWTLAAISKMKKLDSFLKESQRMNQAVLMTFNRRVAKPLRFSDGITLPVGTYITMPSDSVAHDPDIYSNPDKFDGFRFYEKRMSAKSEANRHQFATTGPESLAFGQGKTACPGRFFAGANIKVVIANILLGYHVAFPAGQSERPKNLYKGGLVRPDPKQRIVFTPRAKVQGTG